MESKFTISAQELEQLISVAVKTALNTIPGSAGVIGEALPSSGGAIPVGGEVIPAGGEALPAGAEAIPASAGAIPVVFMPFERHFSPKN